MPHLEQTEMVLARKLACQARETSVPVEPVETSLARVVRELKAHGLGTTSIDSMCKLTEEGLAVYCEELKRGGIHVASVKVPFGRPPGHQVLSCDGR